MSWIGKKKLAFIPVHRTSYDPAPVARTDIIAAKLVPHFTGANPTKNSWVNTQSPEAGAVVPQGSTVTMVLHTGPTP